MMIGVVNGDDIYCGLRPHRDTPDLVWWRSAGLEELTLVDVRFSTIFNLN